MRQHALTPFVVGAAVSIAGADALDCTWVGPLNGDWSVPANWSPGDYSPSNGAGGQTYHALIDGGAPTDAIVTST